MYLGTVSRLIPRYRDQWHDGLHAMRTLRSGSQEQALERYQCEHCARVYEVHGLATEAFYCSDCQRLIGIEGEPHDA